MENNDMVKKRKKHKGDARLNRAEKDYKKMKEEIAPFLKKRIYEVYTTAGQWRESSCLNFQND
ncbi:MAG: hypothetical protein NTW12_06835 [Deltaproteobacteria bacterium]|nr:hypothetical protein [Deltaproteobacteria bacterium]